jgi:hypothetical protein
VPPLTYSRPSHQRRRQDKAPCYSHPGFQFGSGTHTKVDIAKRRPYPEESILGIPNPPPRRGCLFFFLGLVMSKEKSRPRTRLVPTGSNLRSPRRRTLSFPTDHTLQVNLKEEHPHTHTVEGRMIVASTILHLLFIARSSLACVTLERRGVIKQGHGGGDRGVLRGIRE